MSDLPSFLVESERAAIGNNQIPDRVLVHTRMSKYFTMKNSHARAREGTLIVDQMV